MSRGSLAADAPRADGPDAFRILFQRNPLPMWIYDVETFAFLEVNDAAVESYGYSRAEFLEMRIADIRPAEDRERFAGAATGLPAELQIWPTPWRHVRKDGSLCHVRISSHALEFADRAARLVTVQDVSEITRTADALRESREQYRFFIGRTAEGVWRAAVDPPVPVSASEDEQVDRCMRHARLVEVNEAMLRMYACTEAGGLLGSQLSGTFDLADPRSREFFRVFVGSGYRTVELESYEFDREGEPRWFVNNLLGVVEHGRLIAIWGTQRDVTELRQREEMVRAAREHLQALVEASPLPIVSVASGGDVLSWNHAAETVFGWTAAEAIGRRLLCVPDDLDAEYEEFRRRVLAGGAFTGRETVRCRKDGMRIDVSISTSALHDATGRPIGLVAVYEDISGRKRGEELLRQSQEQLRQAQKMEAVGRLAGGVAHDFNNLLSAILSYSEMILADLPDPHPSRGDVEQIRQAGLRAAELTRQLLAFSRRQLMQLRSVDLNSVVAGVDRMLRRVIGEDIELRTVLAPAACCAKADAGQLEQVLMNLVVNARDAMPAGGTLTIATDSVDVRPGLHERDPSPGRYVTLSVCDTGIGMTSELQARIFEPFFTTKGPGHGTGLGLSTVDGIVAQSGGHVVTASAPGAGSTFTIFLPAHAADPDPIAPVAAPAQARSGVETILLVEDEDLVRQLTREILRRNGYHVLVASDGFEAMAILRDSPESIDLMITDVVMPRMSGHELVELARPLRTGMRILYVSGYSEEAIARQGQLTEGIELLSKPFTPGILTAKIRHLLDRSS
ncbi:MAG: PAS domain S-box protein [Gemmatimonadales bacterium]